MEDLRAYYITSEYLTRLSRRVRSWDRDLIEDQLSRFILEHPEYPELQEVLQLELDIRDGKEIQADEA